jgi:hypothetical protein
MLGKWPNPNNLSEMSAWAGGLWIRRVLVGLRPPSARAQEGQLKSAGGLTCVSQPADFRLVCCSSVPTRGAREEGHAHLQVALLLEVRAIDYDAELRMHTEVLCRAYGIGPHDHVLDIGCGAGETTRDAARWRWPGVWLGWTCPRR